MWKNRLLYLGIICAAVFCISLGSSNAQTCSCAATPLFSPIEFSSLQGKKWHFELSYKYHSLNDLVEGRKRVVDDTDRSRSAQSVLFDTRFALSRKFSIRAVFSFVRQSRHVGISNSLPVRIQGLGDSMFMLQYTPLMFADGRKTEISIGTGLKVPIGRSTAEFIGTASEDMQPGTGSWDSLFWVYLSQLLPQIPGFEVFAGGSVRFNGTNTREYKFGTEIISLLGVRWNSKQSISYSVYGRYRWANSDRRFKGTIPNTGGHWLYLVPGISFPLFENMGLKFEGEIPVYRNLHGFRQFSSTFQISFSVFYGF